VIDYEEFIASMLDSQRVAQRSDAVRSSFEKLDRDGDGYISVQDLAHVSAVGGVLYCFEFCGMGLRMGLRVQ
jgi:calcium-dependent protein kinase